MVVERCDHFVMWGRVENFLNLLEEGFSIELGGRNERVLPEQNVLATQSRIKVLVQKVKGSFIAALKDNFDGVLKVD